MEGVHLMGHLQLLGTGQTSGADSGRDLKEVASSNTGCGGPSSKEYCLADSGDQSGRAVEVARESAWTSLFTVVA